MLKKIGFKIKQIPFVPMSGWTGENLNKETTNKDMPKYIITTDSQKNKTNEINEAMRNERHVQQPT